MEGGWQGGCCWYGSLQSPATRVLPVVGTVMASAATHYFPGVSWQRGLEVWRLSWSQLYW